MDQAAGLARAGRRRVRVRRGLLREASAAPRDGRGARGGSALRRRRRSGRTLMFQRVVVAVDGSPQSGKTLPVALDLAQKYGSSVVVVHVREHTRYEGSDVDMGPPIPAQELVD